MSKKITLHNGCTGDQRIAFTRSTITLQHSIQHNEQNTVTGKNQERRETKGDDSFHDAYMKIAPSKAYRHPFAEQAAKYKETGDDLGNDRGNGSTGNAHMEDKDKERIQKDIQDCSDHHCRHAETGKSLGNEKAVHAAGD